MRVAHLETSKLAAMAWSGNPRQIGEHDLAALRRSLREFGVVEPVVVNKRTSRIVGGHQRVKAAEAEGIKTLPVVYVDLDAGNEKLLNLALNRISGDWDDELLARMLADLSSVEEIDLGLSGFSEDELAGLLKRLDGRERRERPEAFDLDAALEEAQAASPGKHGSPALPQTPPAHVSAPLQN